MWYRDEFTDLTQENSTTLIVAESNYIALSVNTTMFLQNWQEAISEEGLSCSYLILDTLYHTTANTYSCRFHGTIIPSKALAGIYILKSSKFYKNSLVSLHKISSCIVIYHEWFESSILLQEHLQFVHVRFLAHFSQTLGDTGWNAQENLLHS